MLTPSELKVVISTLTKRSSWLRKTLEESASSLDPSARAEHTESLKLLKSALKKLSSAPPGSSSKPARKKEKREIRILVAEDSSASANLVLELLQESGFRAIELATDGKEAFDKIKSAREPYDIILCDWDMPGLSGLEVHSKAKASNTLNGAHFMMVTAVTEAARIREAIQQGINDYIVKPIDMEILEGKIKAALAAKTESAE